MSTNPFQSPKQPAEKPTEKPPEEKLPSIAYVLTCWPILLVLVGGAIGGGLGGLACGVNLHVYKSSLPVAAKVAIIPLTGVAAVGLWLAIVAALAPLFA